MVWPPSHSRPELEKPSARKALATQYVAEALEEEPGLTVRSVELEQEGETGLLTVCLDWQGETLTARVNIQAG